MKRSISIILIVILIGGIGFFFWQKNSADKAATSTQRSRRRNMTITVNKSSLEETISGSGYVKPIEENSLSFASRGATGGEIEVIKVQEGDRVEKGQLLAEIDSDDERLDYLNTKNNYEQTLISGSKTEIEEAKLKLEIAKKSLGGTKLKAPFTGIITEVAVEEGDYVESNDTVVQVIDNSAYEVEIDIDESESRQLKLGQKARITMEALPGEELRGEVVDISAIAEEDSGVVTVPVTILIKDEIEFIKSNFSAEVEIIVSEVNNKLMIPLTAIFNEKGQTKAMKIVDGKEVPVNIKTGVSSGVYVVVLDGLVEGDEILINTHNAGTTNAQNSKQGFGGPFPPGGMGRGRK
ncbi:efflux RND transporter periplasmic adaptor subunit [Orenia marismortui]|uniref:efflux RND transporter periplasmic adaptor subunit n=1 Tax=Orenia marismortui TaxID=46469 RepID=UPI000369667E|nr:efflux RND transporter periplasmic adaptor subunit [Orenia marismortui]